MADYRVSTSHSPLLFLFPKQFHSENRFAGFLVYGKHDMPHRFWFIKAHLHAVAEGAFV